MTADESYELSHPFTREELIRAQRVLLDTPGAAEAWVDSMEEALAAMRAAYRDTMAGKPLHEFAPPGTAPAFGFTISDTTLAVLSLLSDEAAQKVAEYRARRRDAPSDEAFRALVEHLRPLVAERLGELEG